MRALFCVCILAGCGGAAPIRDTKPPSVVSTWPADGEVVPDAQSLTVSFDEPVNMATVTAATLLLHDNAGAAVAGSVTAAVSSATFAPSAPLAEGAYVVEATSGILDLAGNPLAAHAWSFTVHHRPPVDGTSPKLVACAPEENATGVALDAAVVLIFDEPVVAGGAVWLSGPGGTIASATSVSGAVVTLTPAAPLAEQTTYTVHAGAGIHDLAGNALDPPREWTFTTGDFTAPRVISIEPADSAVGVDPGDGILIWFGEGIAGSSLTSASFFIAPEGGGAPVAGRITSAGNAAWFIHDAPLAPATCYVVTATSAVTDSAGNALAPFTSSFTTIGAGSGTWEAISAPTPLEPYAARSGPGAAWTGSKLLFWGGNFFGGGGAIYALASGGIYDPSLDSWSAIPSNLAGTPGGRFQHTAVWMGSSLLIWGGTGPGGLYGTGGRYTPGSGWTSISSAGAPSARSDAMGAWTGSEAIVWGGWNPTGFSEFYGDGARYDPAHDTWTAMSSAGVPSARAHSAAVWTGSRFIVWSGDNAGDDGATYDPAGDTWTPIAAAGIVARGHAAAVWTGTRMIVWGGAGLADGAAYDPASNTWSAIASAGAPPTRSGAAAVWTGSKMIVWGGDRDGTHDTATGGLYDPATDSWTLTAIAGAPSPRIAPAAVWTGTQLLIWGGSSGSTAFADGARFTPP